MIIGIGHDLTDVARIAKLVESNLGSRFKQRVLTAGELELAKSYTGERLHQFVAGRFAAKEAISKSFGCGIGSLLGFDDMDIGRDPSGKPVCTLSQEAWSRLKLNASETAIHVTITHERTFASAFVIVERIKL